MEESINKDNTHSSSIDGYQVEISKRYIEHLERINDVFYDQVKISDQKAAYIFTFMLAFLVSSSEGRQVFTMQRYENGVSVGVIASAFLALSSMLSLFCAVNVVLPRHVGKPNSLFWGSWPQQREGYKQAMKRNDPDYLFEQYMTNADALAFIARDKYRFVRNAFRGLLVAVLSYVVLLVAA